MPFVKQNKCIGCGACVETCPVEAISMKDGKAVIDQSKCIHCGKCLNVCLQEAIRPNSEDPDLKKHKFGGQGKEFGFGGKKNYSR